MRKWEVNNEDFFWSRPGKVPSKIRTKDGNAKTVPKVPVSNSIDLIQCWKLIYFQLLILISFLIGYVNLAPKGVDSKSLIYYTMGYQAWIPGCINHLQVHPETRWWHVWTKFHISQECPFYLKPLWTSIAILIVFNLSSCIITPIFWLLKRDIKLCGTEHHKEYQVLAAGWRVVNYQGKHTFGFFTTAISILSIIVFIVNVKTKHLWSKSFYNFYIPRTYCGDEGCQTKLVEHDIDYFLESCIIFCVIMVLQFYIKLQIIQILHSLDINAIRKATGFRKLESITEDYTIELTGKWSLCNIYRITTETVTDDCSSVSKSRSVITTMEVWGFLDTARVEIEKSLDENQSISTLTVYQQLKDEEEVVLSLKVRYLQSEKCNNGIIYYMEYKESLGVLRVMLPEF